MGADVEEEKMQLQSEGVIQNNYAQIYHGSLLIPQCLVNVHNN
jgi:hypothetical protein